MDTVKHLLVLGVIACIALAGQTLFVSQRQVKGPQATAIVAAPRVVDAKAVQQPDGSWIVAGSNKPIEGSVEVWVSGVKQHCNGAATNDPAVTCSVVLVPVFDQFNNLWANFKIVSVGPSWTGTVTVDYSY